MTLKTTHSSHKFSPDVAAQLTTFSDDHGTCKCFLGDYSAITDGKDWDGDEVNVETSNGQIKVLYQDEGVEVIKSPKQGFFGRIFGL